LLACAVPEEGAKHGQRERQQDRSRDGYSCPPEPALVKKSRRCVRVIDLVEFIEIIIVIVVKPFLVWLVLFWASGWRLRRDMSYSGTGYPLGLAAAGDGGNYADLVARFDSRFETVEEPDVFIVQV
jgi:hypothetical protein